MKWISRENSLSHILRRSITVSRSWLPIWIQSAPLPWPRHWQNLTFPPHSTNIIQLKNMSTFSNPSRKAPVLFILSALRSKIGRSFSK
ncbi:hypothetical protein EVA_09210 [gut metagenome]|uniref:Uncharacterized protein n=1 Tax=gut metagenome TaxID=749906 RepID=J9G638_9ZZZZ